MRNCCVLAGCDSLCVAPSDISQWDMRPAEPCPGDPAAVSWYQGDGTIKANVSVLLPSEKSRQGLDSEAHKTHQETSEADCCFLTSSAALRVPTRNDVLSCYVHVRSLASTSQFRPSQTMHRKSTAQEFLDIHHPFRGCCGFNLSVSGGSVDSRRHYGNVFVQHALL